MMPAWQNRQPSVQPRVISTAARSKIASAYGTGNSVGNGYSSRSRTHTRATRSGAPAATPAGVRPATTSSSERSSRSTK